MLDAQTKSEDDERLHGSRYDVWDDSDHAAAALCIHAWFNARCFWRGSRTVGNGFYMVGQSAMADRGSPPPPDARRSSKAIWVQTAYRQSEREDLRAKLSTRVRDRCEGETERYPVGLRHKIEGEVQSRGREPIEHAVRMDTNVKQHLNFAPLRLCVKTLFSRKAAKTQRRTGAVILALCIGAQAQHHAGHAPATEFANLPSPPLLKGIGTASIKITTKSTEAQKYFDQGLNLLHAFWD